MTKISLIVPVRNEAETILDLLSSIGNQTRPPDEVVIVDGGSSDDTTKLVESQIEGNGCLRLVKTAGATPGKGRNIGIEAAAHDWIALTDAGITLDPHWLAELELSSADADIVYGNYDPVIQNRFEKCATLAYVAPRRDDGTRDRFIASSLMKREVWRAVDGFPDLRAAEDLMFMEAVEQKGFRTARAPGARVFWQLRPDIASTWQKFASYSMHNVHAGRQWDWHYGVMRNYAVLIPFVLLAVLNNWWWLAAVPVWLAARAARRILAHQNQFGLAPLVEPITILGVAGFVMLIDAATFVGWVQALNDTANKPS